MNRIISYHVDVGPIGPERPRADSRWCWVIFVSGLLPIKSFEDNTVSVQDARSNISWTENSPFDLSFHQGKYISSAHGRCTLSIAAQLRSKIMIKSVLNIQLFDLGRRHSFLGTLCCNACLTARRQFESRSQWHLPCVTPNFLSDYYPINKDIK